LLEYNGEQHYKLIQGWLPKHKKLNKGHLLARMRQQSRHDRIKREFCEAEHINLLSIPYTHKEKLEEILKEALASPDTAAAITQRLHDEVGLKVPGASRPKKQEVKTL
jgi:hypothetical protein